MLKWVNAENRPEDLRRPPDVLTHLHVEYRKRGFPERHPLHEEHEKHPEHADLKRAAEILGRRNDNAVYGSSALVHGS